LHKSSITHRTLCLCETTQFPHSAQNLDTTIAGRQQALHLLLGKKTHRLPHYSVRWKADKLARRSTCSRERLDNGYPM